MSKACRLGKGVAHVSPITQRSRGVEEESTGRGYDAIDRRDGAHVWCVVKLRAYHVGLGGQGGELRIGRTTDSICRGSVVLYVQGLAENALRDIDDFVVFLIDKVAPGNELLQIAEFARLLSGEVAIGRGDEFFTITFRGDGRC